MLKGGAPYAEAGLNMIEDVGEIIDTISDIPVTPLGAIKSGGKKVVKKIVKEGVGAAEQEIKKTGKKIRPSHGGGRGRSQKTRPSGKKGAEAQDQLDGLLRKQEHGRKYNKRGYRLKAGKSKQSLDNKLKRLRNRQDAEEEFYE